MNFAPDSMVGRVLGGRYRIERAIGRGGMGAVYQATQLDLGRRVALKVLLELDPRGVARLRQEALTAGSLSCPHIVSIFDFQAVPGEPPFVVMELLAGESLAELLARERVLAVPRACRVAAEALAGLDFAHRAGITHRDVKPSNLWLSAGRGIDGHVKVLDFGIAKQVGGAGLETTTGSLLGTPAYLAPEQLRGREADERSDQHAIGVILFEMLTGHRPWQAQGVAIYAEVLERVPPLIDRLAPHVPHELAVVVARALAKDPAQRFASADELRRHLLPFAQMPDSARLAAASAPSLAPHTPPIAAVTAVPGGYYPHPPAGSAHATTKGGRAASRSSSWIVALVGGLLVLAVGLAAAAFALRDRLFTVTAGPTTTPDAAPGPVATAGPSLAGSSAVAPTAADAPAVDAGPAPRAGTSPARPVRADGGTAPGVAPSSLADAGATKPRCECVSSRGDLLCQKVGGPPPKCSCQAESGVDVCFAPYKDGKCLSKSITGTSLSHRAECKGFISAGDKSTAATGKLDCNYCYPPDKHAAIPGAACEGIVPGSDPTFTRKGIWVCDP